MKTFAVLIAISFLAVPLVAAQETYGTIKVTTRLHDDGTSITLKVDPDQRTAEETTWDGGKPPKLLKKVTYLLGEKDLYLGAIFYDAKGNVTYKASYQRDGAGRISESAFTAADGRYLGKRAYVYTGAAAVATQVIDYDANGQVISQAQAVGPKAAKKRR